MNPAMPNKLAKRIPLTAPRLATLEGKTIYLVDIQWGGPEGGYSLLEVASALQKAIRRADARLAGYWAIELFESGYRDYLWRRLLTISAGK